jgi:hypothetical protein
MIKIILIGLAIILIGGVAFSIQDWRQWKQIELANYGKGESTIVYPTASPLGRLYSHSWGKFRIKYPLGWTVTENKLYIESKQNKPTLNSGERVELVKFESPDTSAKVTVWMESGLGVDLPAFINREGEGVSRDREFINTDYANMTILTYEKNPVRQMAISSKGDRILIIETNTDSVAWVRYAQTFLSVFRSLVWL